MGAARGLLVLLTGTPECRREVCSTKVLFAILILFAAIFGGGAIIWAIESFPETSRREQAKASLARAEETLYADLKVLLGTTGADTAEVRQRVDDYVSERKVLDEAGATQNWTYLRSSFFCFTLLTTIGYGSFAPSTPGGQAFVVLFSLFGFGCFAYAMSTLGSLVSSHVRGFCNEMLDLYSDEHKKEVLAKPADKHLSAMLMIATFAMLLVTCVYMLLTYGTQGWGFGTAFYFTFVTLTTIGLGDLSIENNGDANADYLLVPTMVITLVGLAFLAGALVEIQNFLASGMANVHVGVQRKVSTRRNNTCSDDLSRP